jgi:hypothetical protein
MRGLMQKLSHCAGSCVRWYAHAARTSIALAFGLCALTTVATYPAAAEEATTAPTCTGCSGAPAVTRHAKPPKPSRSAPKVAARPAAKPAVNNEGSWSGVSKGPCIVTWRWTIEVANGSISGKNTTGHVARTGAASGTMVVFGKTYKFVGHFNGSTGAGSWKSVECGGTWTSAKS